jgi:hypothetical protein
MNFTKHISKYFYFLVFVGLWLVLFRGLPVGAAEATAKLYFLPASGNFTVGDNIQVRVAVDTGNQAINAVEGTITFSNTLECVNTSKTGTILNLWIQEPNCLGNQITFSGGIPNPGFTGVGRLFIINFKAKAEGAAWVKFNNAQVLANDGLGTNILGSTSQANFIIQKSFLPKPQPVELPESGQICLNIFSSTHSDSNQWYKQREVLFTWQWQQGITDFSYILNQEAKTIPDNISEGLHTAVSYANVSDGIWYFHLKAKTKQGWSATEHYKIQIDGTPPSELKIIPQESLPSYNPSPILKFEAKDELSGISYYEVKVDEKEWVKINENQYQVPVLTPGKHQVLVRVYDKANNYLEEKIDLEILPLSAPKIVYWTKQILFGEPFFVRGRGTPNLKINLTIYNQERVLNLITRSNEKGEWQIEHKEILPKGEYKLCATQETISGAVSSPSEEKSFEVLTNAIKIFGFVLPTSVIIWLIIFLLLIIAILIVLILFFRRSFKKCDTFLKDFFKQIPQRAKNKSK